MGLQTIVHGRINLCDDSEKSCQFIKTLEDERYPAIRAEMFSTGANEKPFYYENMVLAFAANYKNLEYDFKSFIIKFEYILQNIEFETVKLQMETEFYGTYNFFWKSKRFDTSDFAESEPLIETPEWFFGYGYRSKWGTLEEVVKSDQVFSIDFEYPIKYDNKILFEFNNAIKDSSINQMVTIKTLSCKLPLKQNVLKVDKNV